MIENLRYSNRETPWLEILLVTAVEDDGPPSAVHVLSARLPSISLRLGRISSGMLPPMLVLLSSQGDLEAREEIHRMLMAMHMLCEYDELRATAEDIERLVSGWEKILAQYHECLDEFGTVIDDRRDAFDALARLM